MSFRVFYFPEKRKNHTFESTSRTNSWYKIKTSQNVPRDGFYFAKYQYFAYQYNAISYVLLQSKI